MSISSGKPLITYFLLTMRYPDSRKRIVEKSSGIFQPPMLPRCVMDGGLIKARCLADAPSVDARTIRKRNGVPTVDVKWNWRDDNATQ